MQVKTMATNVNSDSFISDSASFIRTQRKHDHKKYHLGATHRFTFLRIKEYVCASGAVWVKMAIFYTSKQ
jgi:hypothetical protein